MLNWHTIWIAKDACADANIFVLWKNYFKNHTVPFPSLLTYTTSAPSAESIRNKEAWKVFWQELQKNVPFFAEFSDKMYPRKNLKKMYPMSYTITQREHASKYHLSLNSPKKYIQKRTWKTCIQLAILSLKQNMQASTIFCWILRKNVSHKELPKMYLTRLTQKQHSIEPF